MLITLYSILLATWAVVSAAATTCDRTCLEGVMDTFLKALTAHNTSLLLTTSDVLYVENNQVLTLGTGEWLVASSPGKYRHVFADPQQGQVGAITTIVENGVRTIYVARLKVDADGRVSEIETQITRDPAGAALYESMTVPEAVWLQPVAPADRVPRETLIAQANRYYSGMERNDPHGDYSFFDKDCNRIEDALQTTNQKTGAAYGHSNDTVFASLGCAAQFQTGFLGFVTQIRSRRFPVVDEERQAVLAMTTLDHNGTVRFLPDPFDVNNGSAAQPIPPYFDVPRSLQAAEAFRLKGDKLFRIEMTLTEVPYRMKSPFLPVEHLRYLGSNSTNSTAASFSQPCDRASLRNVTDRVLDTLLHHKSPSSLPIADGAIYTENGQVLDWGNGLWETLQEIGADRAYFSDPDTNTAGFWGATREQTTPGVLALRIQLDSHGRIRAIDVYDVRAEVTGARGGTMTLMRPPLPVEWQGAPLGKLDSVFTADNNHTEDLPDSLVDAYFDGLQRHTSAGVPLSKNCLRRDNGQFLANSSCADQMKGLGVNPNGLYNTTSAVRDRRVLVRDHKLGVVLAVAMVDNDAVPRSALNVTSTQLPPTQRVPSTYMVPQLIKVVDGQIVRVESMIKWMPYGYWPF
ncbi:hypothetical protein SEUCBS139899_009868 [Sporothrix eucalyptigena]|uniref:DUF8021 domain-containing protein n=1 Tax=Sporothrix eucalyptigena TaxID=1812306 RepID=A0ABP0CYW3_9PEZI